MTSPVDESHSYLGSTKQICVINQLQPLTVENSQWLQPWEIYPFQMFVVIKPAARTPGGCENSFLSLTITTITRLREKGLF